MRLGLIGYGAMNRRVAERASAAGHEIVVVLRSANAGAVEEMAERLRGLDVVIDFSVAEAVASNVRAATMAGVPIVEGTTGWDDRRADVLGEAERAGAGLVYAANFSVGVNLFYRVVREAGELFAGFEAYLPFIEEAHHRRKRDAPSGTALRLRSLLAESYAEEVPVASTRAGFIPGTHRVGFDSEADQILLTHTARSRDGFADGALVAAAWIQDRKGIYSFDDVLDEMIAARSGVRGGDDLKGSV